MLQHPSRGLRAGGLRLTVVVQSVKKKIRTDDSVKRHTQEEIKT